jgi:hypothetical protein
MLQQTRVINANVLSNIERKILTGQWKCDTTTEETTIRELLLKDLMKQDRIHRTLMKELNMAAEKIDCLVT